MKPVKLVHVANIDVGLKIHLGNYMRYLREQGYEVSAITHPGQWLSRDTTILDGIFVKVLAFEPRLSPGADLKTLARLVRYFRRERFDIVHTHTVKPGLLGRLAAKLAGVPIVVHTVHGFYFYEGMPARQYRFYVNVEKIGSACSQLILSQNRQDIATALQEKICPPQKIHYLGNGIDLDRFNPQHITTDRIKALRDELGIRADEQVIGFVARWEREKGIYEFLDAARLVTSQGIKAKFLIAGAAQKHKNSAVSPQDMLHSFGLEENTLLLAYREDIPELLSIIDVVVLPSYGREGVPRILMESAAMGKPVVATRVRGNVEAVDDDITGILAPVRDGPALAEGMLRLLRNPAYAMEMGRRARQKALTHFDEREFFWRTDMEYRRLLEARLGMDTNSALNPAPGQLIGSGEKHR